MKIGRLPTFITLLTILILTACRDEPQPVSQITFTPSPNVTFTPRPSTTPTLPSPTNAKPTNTAEPTSIQTPTPVPTTRVRPTATLRPTTTQTPFPNILLTPATPPAPTGYRLKPWTAEDADNLGRLMEAYYESMGEIFFSRITLDTWHGTAQFAGFAYREAQFRFHDDPRLLGWQLGEAVNMAISGSPRGALVFQSSLQHALNTGQITPTGSEIRNWLLQYPSDYELQIEELSPPPGYLRSYIVSIAPYIWVGGITIWVLEDDAGFTVYSIHNNLGDSFSTSYSFDIKSLTSSEPVNVVITADGQNGSFRYAEHFIYDLSQIPPGRIDFGPRQPWFFGVVNGIRDELGEDGLLHFEVQDRDLCFLWLNVAYAWNGLWLEEINAETQYWPTGDRWECFVHWLTFRYPILSDIERTAVLTPYEEVFEDIRPSGTDYRTGESFAPDAQDEFRFYLALNHAVLGHVEQAREYLQRIINIPSIEDSSWIEPAEIFLAAYNSAADLYPACHQSALDICPYDNAFETSVANQPPMDWPTLRSLIIDWGTLIAANGSFDFDNDGQLEHWLALRHQPNEPLELWLFGQGNQGWTAVYVDRINTIPQTFQLEIIDSADLHHNLRYNKPAFDHTIFSIDDGPIYAFFRHPVHRQPYVRRLHYRYIPTPDPLGDQRDAIIDALLTGTDPTQVINDLLTLVRPDAQYYYYLGLAYELSGDEQNAVTAYLTAWQEHCCDTWSFGPYGEPFNTANPYAIMAQAKLIPN